MSEVEPKPPDGSKRASGRASFEAAVCIGAALGADAIHASGCPIPTATMTLFGAMAAASMARRVAPRHASPMNYSTPLSLGLILVGVQLQRTDLASLGWGAPLWILGYQGSVALILAWFLRRQVFCRRGQGLLAMGLSGAGLASVLAVTRSDPKAPKDVVPLVLSGILCTGALGFVLFPWIGRACDLPAATLSCWVGISMPTTSEAVLVGADHSEKAMRLTAAWRLLVNGLQWIPIATYLAVFAPNANPGHGRISQGLQVAGTTMRGIPLFVWGLAAVGGLGYANFFAEGERRALGALTYWVLLVALAGIGWNTRPRDFLRFGLGRMVSLVSIWVLSTFGLLLVLLARSS